MDPSLTFAEWAARYDTPDEAFRAGLERQVQDLADPPTISVLLPVYDPPVALLREAIESVLGQWYPHWELCIADDCSTDPAVGEILARYAAGDRRVKVVRRTDNGHIAAATNSALAVATGRWVAFLDHDDLLAPQALATVAVHLAARPDAGLVYSDEDLVDVDGHRIAHYFKPDFDPLLLLGQNSICHLCVVRRDLVEEIGGLSEGYEGSQDWDLVLRVSEHLDRHQVVHVPQILYHWRTHPASTSASLAAKPYAAGAGFRAVRDHMDRRYGVDPGQPGSAPAVEPIPGLGWNRVRRPLPDPAPLVTIVVRCADGDRLDRCLRSVWGRTTYPRYEIVVVGPGTASPAAADLLRREAGRLRVVGGEGVAGPSTLANRGAALATGQVLCFVDEAAEVVSPDWMGTLVSQVLCPGVGAVGAGFHRPDGRLRDAGLVLGLGGAAGPAHPGLDRLDIGYWGRAALPRQVSAVSGDGLAVRREAWEAAGGFDDAHLPGPHADVDLCLRLAVAGWITVWEPFAELLWSRPEPPGSGGEPSGGGTADEAGPGSVTAAVRYLRARWGPKLDDDPAYNPNLSLDRGDFSPASPPRGRRDG